MHITESMEDLYNNAPCGYFSTLPDGLIIKINNTLLSLLGCERAEVEGKMRFQDCLTIGSKIYYDTHYYPLLQMHGSVREINFELRKKDDTRLPVLINSMKVTDDKNSHLLTRSMVFDISQRKMYEKEILLAKQKADELAAQLTRINKELEQFAYAASHDLRSPLSSVLLSLELLKRNYSNTLGEAGINNINIAVKGIKKISKLVLDLLKYSSSGYENVEYEWSNLDEILEEVRFNLSNEFNEKLVTLTVEPNSFLAKVNKSDIIRLFQNLLENALKYGQEGKEIVLKIGVKEEDTDWQFRIEDNGIGIDPAYHEKIFDPFTRVPNSKHLKGSGIGLATCKKIVEQHQGKIWVESTPGEGSTFYFTISKKL